MDKKVYVVTGAEGWIGSRVASKLRELGHTVKTIDMLAGEEQDLVQMRINNSYWLEVDGVFACHGISGDMDSVDSGEPYLRNNALASDRMFQHWHHRKIVYLSSLKCNVPWKNPYIASMFMKECSATENSLGLRIGSIFGEGAPEDNLIEKIVNNNLEFLSYHQYREYTYINDLVDIMIKMMNTDIVGVVDIGLGEIHKHEKFKDTFNLDVPNGFEHPLYEHPGVVAKKEDVALIIENGFKVTKSVFEYINQNKK